MASMVLYDILYTGDYIGREIVAIAVHDFDGVKVGFLGYTVHS
jgi:hypothetical protein